MFTDLGRAPPIYIQIKKELFLAVMTPIKLYCHQNKQRIILLSLIDLTP